MDYYKKLKNPKWQKKRLEVLDCYEFECCNCGETEKELHVHHKHYIYGREPWEYDVDQFWVLCKACHRELTKAKKCLNNVIGEITCAEQLYRIRTYAMCMGATDFFHNELTGDEYELLGFSDYFREKDLKNIRAAISESKQKRWPINFSKKLWGQSA